MLLGTDRTTEALHATLEVRRRPRVLSPQRGGKEDVRPERGCVSERADADHDLAVGERGARQRPVGKLDQRIRVDQHENFDLAVGRGADDPGRVEPAQLRHAPHSASKCS